MKLSIIISSILLLTASLYSQQDSQELKSMTLNAGIITQKLAETKAFYTTTLGFGVSFENDFYLLLHTPNHQAEISFLQPHHPSQKPIFQAPFEGKGVYLTIEVDNVDAVYQKLKEKGTPIEFELQDEVWGDRHFSIVDPNGIGIDIVSYSKREQ